MLWSLERQDDNDTASSGRNSVASNLGSMLVPCNNLFSDFYGAAA